MKNLQSIINKYSTLQHNEDNYSVGGGLTDGKFASNRHEDAKTDAGKLTFGQAAQMFKKATGKDTDYVNSIFDIAVPFPEWHHAGKLPNQYGGGMKKTYFLNSAQIVDIAENWGKYEQKLKERQSENEAIKNASKNAELFAKAYGQTFSRSKHAPEFSVIKDEEMQGKYGWFAASYTYNLTRYYSGIEFKSKALLQKYHNILSGNILPTKQTVRGWEKKAEIITAERAQIAAKLKEQREAAEKERAAKEQAEKEAEEKRIASEKAEKIANLKKAISAGGDALLEWKKAGCPHPAPVEVYNLKQKSGLGWNTFARTI